MFRSKIIKKRTKNRETLLRNLRKGKARLEPRCSFQVIPAPLKYSYPTQTHQLYADVILMEHHNSILTEPSLLNNFKFFKNIHINNTSGQKIVKLMPEDRTYEPVNWKQVVERFENSDSTQIRAWAESVKNFCERYETIIRDYEIAESSGLSSDMLKSYKEMTDKTDKLRQNLEKNYPCIEMKSQLRNGQIKLTEMNYSEKFISELGYSLESFASTVFEEGLPK
jgi:hypothetical protein